MDRRRLDPDHGSLPALERSTHGAVATSSEFARVDVAAEATSQMENRHSGSVDSELQAFCAPTPTIRCPRCGTELRVSRIELHVEGRGDENVIQVRLSNDGLGLREQVNAFQRTLIVAALAKHGGVKARAAEALGLKYTTFIEMGKRLDIPGFDARGHLAAS
ncbi:MAG: helix-turn-helix domain-containing protein [Acidobacteriota bacterium]